MTYELALKLKNAGFPQEESRNEYPLYYDSWEIEHEKEKPFSKMRIPLDSSDRVTLVYIPTLEELIDFVDGSDRIKGLYDEYTDKALQKLQKNNST